MDHRKPTLTNATSMRVLSRPPPNLRHSRTPPPTSLDTIPTLPQGVVVVGFISRGPEISSQIINRILDSHVFGSGHLDKPFSVDDTKELLQWFKYNRIRYYHEEDKGIVYLQFYSTWCTVVNGFPGSNSEIESFLGDREYDELQGLLFVFSVCHVVIYIQEGSNFDTQLLKKFKVLQAAKHAWALNSRAKQTHSVSSRLHSLSTLPKQANYMGSSPGTTGHIINRNVPALSSSHGLAAHTSLPSAHLIPVMHFVFVDEFEEIYDANFRVEESDNLSFNLTSSLNATARPDYSSNNSAVSVILTRPPNKSEGGFKKKLQSSLESQIRFLIKKCRTLSVSESSHNGSRTGVTLNHTPLFSLDASRAATLIHKTATQISESLEFTIDLVEDVLMGKKTSDILLHESQDQSSNKEDIQALKEFINRQSDTVRGRGGTVTSANSGSSPSVGMVAVAAAAAAAAASSGKLFFAPKLATIEMWMTSSKDILSVILSFKHGTMDNKESVVKLSNKQDVNNSMVDTLSPKASDALDHAASVLESVRSLNTKFSTAWCEKSLPLAVDIYLKDLPPCYPTSLHEVHLENALRSFLSMVRGPVVDAFAKRLESNCITLWKSGRQQCDAISLSGKPCIHQKHESTTSESDAISSSLHSSGYFFLHACACGRSRCLRPDPFDLESANVNFNCFPECDMLLPVAHVPNGNHNGAVLSSSWKLIRIGGASYYDPSKGLLQSGFSFTQRFLFKWTIPPIKPMLFGKIVPSCSVYNSVADSKTATGVDINMQSEVTQLQFGNIQTGLEQQREFLGKDRLDRKKEPNSTMRKFAEVVAGSSTSNDSFPALKHIKSVRLSSGSGKKQNKVNKESSTTSDQTSLIYEGNSSTQRFNGSLTTKRWSGNNSLLSFGSNVNDEKKQSKASVDSAVAYVGFEHECPRGHRFFLSTDTLGELKPPHPSLSMERSDLVSRRKNNPNGKDNGNEKYGNVSQIKGRGRGTPQDSVPDDNIKIHGMKVSRLSKELDQISLVSEAGVVSHDEDGLSDMLNHDLPLYMNCPYCVQLKKTKVMSKVNFADGISQLQRIFLVTPPLPIVLTTLPVIHFEASCLPPSMRDENKKLQFSFGCPVVLPPESFIIMKLPFVYGIHLDNGRFHPLKSSDIQPEKTAWMEKGTALQVLSTEPGSL